MGFSFSGIEGATGTVILAVVAWLGALLMGGLMTAHYRVSGLYRNGLLEKERLGPVLRNALEDSRRFLVTISTLHLAMTMLGCFAWGHFLSRSWPGPLDLPFYLLFGGSSLLAWSLGGLVFKMLASGTAATYVQVVGTLVFPLSIVLRPWSTLMLAVMDRLDDTLWIGDVQTHLSTGEIRSLISEDGENVVLDEDEREMIQSIFTFHDTAVREIMIPRIDMVTLDGDADVGEMVQAVIDSGHSRVPVYQGNADKIIGILYSKDLLKLVDEGMFGGGGRKLADLVRPAYFIPESKKIDEVLDEFRTQRIHMAVVIDEYGGTAGLVTLEDVIEEIVGEIEDEFDEEEELLVWVDERTVRLDPKIDLEDLQEGLGVDLTHIEGWETSETLGGLIYEAAGKVPDQGDRIPVSGFIVTVENVEDQRLILVLLEAKGPLPGFPRPEEV
ncbi:MAG: hemolysin family protein [Gemmatimonadales bacterium]|nr:hemolysin family protein [Gemmatimonadales bacterium]